MDFRKFLSGRRTYFVSVPTKRIEVGVQLRKKIVKPL